MATLHPLEPVTVAGENPMHEQKVAEASPAHRTTAEAETDDAILRTVSDRADLHKVGIEGLMTEIAHQMKDRLPECQIEFENLSYSVEVDGEDEATKIPTVGSTFIGLAKSLMHTEKNTKRTVTVLNNMTGVLAPGTMTLLLTPAGHGKTSFLKALSGRIPKSKLGGEIWYGGRRAEELNVNRLCGYIDQDDRHLPQLTVRETFKFAHDCMTTMEDLSEFMMKATQNKVDNCIELFGLSNAKDTIVGDDLTRGVSGGEKKRVTFGEIIMGNNRAILADEISTGLDSATTYDIANLLRMATKKFAMTTVVALLQPPPEVYALFDRVLLLREGSIVYHGPRRLMKRYFNEMGLFCPSDQDEADWIVEFLTDPNGVWERDLARMREERGDPLYMPAQVPPLTTDELVLYLEASLHRGQWGMLAPIHLNTFTRDNTEGAPTAEGQTESKSDEPATPVPAPVTMAGAMCHPLDTVCISGPAKPIKLETEWQRKTYGESYSVGLWKQLGLLATRSFQLILRNPQLIGAHVGQSVFMGLVIGSLFWQASADDFALRYGLVFFALLMVAFVSMSEVPVSVQNRDVAYKQLEARFYSVPVYIIGQTLPGFMLSGLDALLFGSITYWMTGFEADFGRFCFFILCLFLSAVAFGQLFRAISYIMPTLAIAQSMSAPIVAIFMLFAGFLITREEISDWLIWAYWFTPLSWGLRSLLQNEFFAPKYDEPLGSVRKGDFYLSAYQIQTDDWRWAGVAYMIAFYFFALIISMVFLTKLRYTAIHKSTEGNKTNKIAPSLRNKTTETAEETTVDATAVAPQLSVQPVTLAFENLTYTVPIKNEADKTLLAGISGYARPGTMTALMGSSGAGKTTLMDVLAGRKTGGTIGGKITVNGRPKDDEEFRHIVGYVEQQDLHEPYQTVREALRFSAQLRLREPLEPAALELYVANTLEILELSHVADVTIGDLSSGLPVGERKRVTIGVELVANPAVLFLDEPTSGLDSRSADIVMRVVARIAAAGRTVVATIHQPAASIFFRFDQLLLLRRGGATVYFGSIQDRAAPLITYLESKDAEPLPKNVNPANWMLEVIAPKGKGAESVDFAKVYAESDLQATNATTITEALAETNGAVSHGASPIYATGFVQQLKYVFKRSSISYWRNVGYNASRILVLMGLGIVFGVLYFNLSTSSLGGISSLLAALMIVMLFGAAVNLLTSVNPLMTSRASYYREQASRTYAPVTFGLSVGVLEVPYTILATIPFSCIFYWMAGLKNDAETFIHFSLTNAFLSLAFNSFGHVLAAVAPNEQIAGIMAGGIMSLLNLFSGFFVPQPDIPSAWIWLYWANPVSHALRAVVMPQFFCEGDVTQCPTVAIPDGTGGFSIVTVSNYMEGFTGHDFDERWLYCFTVLAFAVGYRLLSILALTFITHQSR